jgi:hypothetical protein
MPRWIELPGVSGKLNADLIETLESVDFAIHRSPGGQTMKFGPSVMGTLVTMASGTVHRAHIPLAEAHALVDAPSQAQVSMGFSNKQEHPVSDAPKYTPPPHLTANAQHALEGATPEQVDAAARLYHRYGRTTDGKSDVTGATLPAFTDCNVLVKAGWLAVADEARAMFAPK